MRLWTIQPKELYERLKTDKVVHCDSALSEHIAEWGFGPAYDWLAVQMKRRVGQPPEGVIYPIWAWHTLDWKHRKPDLRCTEFRAYRGDQVCLELEIADKMVLLSDEELWHYVLNDWYYGDCTNEREMEKEDAWFDSLSPEKQTTVKVKSWEKIFNVSPPYESAWEYRGRYVQATFWELRLDQVVAVRNFKGRLSAVHSKKMNSSKDMKSI